MLFIAELLRTSSILLWPQTIVSNLCEKGHDVECIEFCVEKEEIEMVMIITRTSWITFENTEA